MIKEPIIKATENYAEIIPKKLYFGDNEFPKDLQNLSKFNITTIIDLIKYKSPSLIPKYPQNIKYYHYSIVDNPTSTIDWCEEVCNLMEEEIKSKNSVLYIHCAAGISRSTTCILYYLMKKEKKNLKESFELVRKLRNVASPVYGFFKGLTDLDLKIFGKNSITVDDYAILILSEDFPDIKLDEIKKIWEESKDYYNVNKKEYLDEIKKFENKKEPIGVRTFEKIYERFGKDKQIKRNRCYQYHPFE